MGGACGALFTETDLIHPPVGKGKIYSRYGGTPAFKALVDLLFAKILRHDTLARRF